MHTCTNIQYTQFTKHTQLTHSAQYLDSIRLAILQTGRAGAAVGAVGALVQILALTHVEPKKLIIRNDVSKLIKDEIY